MELIIKDGEGIILEQKAISGITKDSKLDGKVFTVGKKKFDYEEFIWYGVAETRLRHEIAVNFEAKASHQCESICVMYSSVDLFMNL